MRKFIPITFILLLMHGLINAQLITAVPAFPTDADSVAIYFDASLGNKALKGYTGDVYAHTGVITDKSTSGSDWKYVKTNWGVNSEETKLTRISTDKYVLKIKPGVRAYYNVPEGEKIVKMAFVFRSSDSKLEGKSETGGDIYYDIYSDKLSVDIVTPDQKPYIINVNTTVVIKLAANKADSVQLLINNVRKSSTTAAELNATYTPILMGKYSIKAVAWANNESVTDSTYFFAMGAVNEADLPYAGLVDGINYKDANTVTLVLYAPFKNYVFAIGDFSNWEVNADVLMNRTSDGKRYWITLSNLEAGKEYGFQYLVNGNLRIADPYTDMILDPWNDKYIPASIYPNLKAYPEGLTTGVVSVFQTNKAAYTWKTANFTPPAKESMVIYELHVRDFTANSDIQTVIDSFSYLKKLGINVLELMPVSEFEGNDSWGYNPAFYFAPDKAYGTRNKLKELIDSCHTNGIAVLLDMVLNHSYGLSPLVQLYFDGTKPTTQNPWYNVTSPNTAYSWGYDFNHQSADTKIFVDRVNKYWLTEYKFDGFRFDFTKGFTNTPGDGGAFDQQRIDILKRMNAEIKKVNPNAIVILEHFADNAEEKILAADGMFVWGNITYSFGEAAMGWHENNKSDFTWLSYKARQYTTPNVVGYMESHDEERIMFKALTYGNTMNNVYPIKNNVENALDRSQLNALFLMCTPGPKMIWQFGELGYDISIDFNGRVGRKPVKWEYFQEPSRKKLYDVYCAVNKLKTKQAAMSSSDFTTSYTGTTKSLTIKHADFDLILVGNYGVFPEEATVTFTKTGWWYNYLTGDSVQVTDLTTKFVINPSGFRLLTSKKIANSSTITALPGNGISSKMAMQSFPNPFVNEVVFSIDSETSEQATMSIYSIGGKLVHNQQINLNAGNNQISWNTDHQDLENGLYVCVVHSKSASYICKIVKN